MTDCAAPRHDQAAEASPHAWLCHPCEARLRADLRSLPRIAGALAELLDPRQSGTRSRGSGDGLPFNEGAAECISQITHDVTWWCRELGAISARPAPAAEPLDAACAWLRQQVKWAVYRPFAGDMAAAFRDVRRRADAIIDPLPSAVIAIPADLNWCEECGATGTLTAFIYHSEYDHREPKITCACGREWDTTQWLKLGNDIIRWRDGKAA